VVKLALKRLVISCPTPAGCVFPSASFLVEPRHLRQDNSRPGDLYAIGHGMHRKDSVMDLVIASRLHKSCLPPSYKSSDYVIRNAENKKFKKDLRSTYPIHDFATRRLIPPAQNHLGLRGGRGGASKWL